MSNQKSLVGRLITFFGDKGPYIMLLTALPIFKEMFLKYTLVGFVFNVLLNAILKFIFQHERPNESVNHIKRYDTESFINSITNDPFGFPSGHSQISTYLAAMMHNAFGLKPITIIYITYACFIMWQRWYDQRHKPYQIATGALIGAVVASGVFYVLRNRDYLMGHILHKVDDWSRIF
jgi:membrane-associated phospholipid phosphatase